MINVHGASVEIQVINWYRRVRSQFSSMSIRKRVIFSQFKTFVEGYLNSGAYVTTGV